MKRFLIAGNWKMNMLPTQAKQFAAQLVKTSKSIDDDVEVMIAPPFTALAEVKEAIKGSKVKLGAQNINENEKGAFTGEISADMLLDIGVEYIITGHSERRTIYQESDELINKKVHSAVNHSLKPLLCVGELLTEKEAGLTHSVIEKQISKGLKDISRDGMKKIIIAYEPIWAIGTGRVANPQSVEEIHFDIRKIIARLYTKDIAENILILYGGSVSVDNIDGLMTKPNINGALVGGASLKIDLFSRIASFRKMI
ncbi:MAG: triose-phosphate isomerase [Spirochaetes bacterium]|nr:triose-phosphate isomerase [Spirochaetota bacterium]